MSVPGALALGIAPQKVLAEKQAGRQIKEKRGKTGIILSK
jgi:hypothetical protein